MHSVNKLIVGACPQSVLTFFCLVRESQMLLYELPVKVSTTLFELCARPYIMCTALHCAPDLSVVILIRCTAVWSELVLRIANKWKNTRFLTDFAWFSLLQRPSDKNSDLLLKSTYSEKIHIRSTPTAAIRHVSASVQPPECIFWLSLTPPRGIARFVFF